MTNKSVAQICAIAAVVALPTVSWAGTASKEGRAAGAPEKLGESIITGDIGLNVVTSYYYHGVIQQNHAPSFQPYLDLNFKAYEGDGFLNKAVFTLGLWQSFTDGSTRPKFDTSKKLWENGNHPSTWAESDFTPGVSLTFGKLTLTESYQFMFYPTADVSTSESIVSKLSFDDSDLLGAFALHPSITNQHEVSGKAGNGKGTHGDYWELAVAPSASVGPVTVSVPLTLAYGTSHYYSANGLGYFSAGLNVGYALPLPKNYGTWTATAGATYYNIDRSTINNALNNPTSHQDVVGSIGLGVAF